jgi:serine/threonine protein kinase
MTSKNINTNKNINKYKYKNKNKKGGKVIASGGFGCVFSPALKCEGDKNREKGKISKLMTEKHAVQEYEEINNIREKLKDIKDYKNYFLIDDLTLCKPAKLTQTDLIDYTTKCTALQKEKEKDVITKNNINDNLNKLMVLNIPDGGIPVDDFIYDDGTFLKMYNLHTRLIELLEYGIVPMNKKNIYHCDLKDSNVLVDKSEDTNNPLKTRIIDWGLTTEYQPFKDVDFPSTWRNRPLQFNSPISAIIFSDAIVDKYTKYIICYIIYIYLYIYIYI